MTRHAILLVATLAASVMSPTSLRGQEPTMSETKDAMRRAGKFYANVVANHGGYVYFYSLDLKQRWGEGVATLDQIWVQPPGTPTVGLAFLRAYESTGEQVFLDAGLAAARALIHGQLKSGGWTNCIDFDPKGERSADYRNGKGRGKNNSSLDDGQTQSAIRLLIHADRATEFKDREIHNAALLAIKSLLAAQFPNGGFPQVWTGPVEPKPILQASYPDDDWRTKGRIKNYWDMYTLNDNVCGYVADTLIDAHEIYQSEALMDALKRLGDFLLLAQMPEPQPGWAQQYNDEMKPIWARKFEPPGISGDETQEVIETLIKITVVTRDKKYLEPIPRAIQWLRRSELPDGKLARYYELKTNRPLYMKRNGKRYTLTYSDRDLPKHYGWKTTTRADKLERMHRWLSETDWRNVFRFGQNPGRTDVGPMAKGDVREIIDSLDGRGRWVSTYEGERLVGQPKMVMGSKFLSSEVFSANLNRLSAFYSAAARDASIPRELKELFGD